MSVYDESYPPEILRGYTPPATPVTAARRAAGGRTFVVAAGTPGSYEPEVPATERPRNVTELREVARVTDPSPWPAGAYVLVGTAGKRAHWGGDDWHGDASPGYPDEPAGSGVVTLTEIPPVPER